MAQPRVTADVNPDDLQRRVHALTEGFKEDKTLEHGVLGERSLRTVMPELRSLRALIGQLKTTDLDRLPQGALKMVSDELGEVESLFIDVAKFHLPEAMDEAEKDKHWRAITRRIRNVASNVFKEVGPYIALSFTWTTSFDQYREQIQGLVKRFKDDKRDLAAKFQGEADTAISNFNEKAKVVDEELQRVKDGLDKVREERTTVTIAKHAEHFQREALQHLFYAIGWLVAAVIIGWFTIHYVYDWISGLPPLAEIAALNIDLSSALAFSLPRVVFLSLLTTAIGVAVRNFHANQHNYVVNRHRMRSLSTFDAFVTFPGATPEVQNAMLLHTAAAIFAPQATGFSKVDHEIKPLHPGIDLISSAAKKSGPST